MSNHNKSGLERDKTGDSIVDSDGRVIANVEDVFSVLFADDEAKKRDNKKPLPPVGTGERFKLLVRQLSKKGIRDPKALAAWIGRKKYGKKRFQQLTKGQK